MTVKEDKLEEIFRLQKRLDDRIVKSKQRVTVPDQCRSIIHEAVELTDCYNWKWWKPTKYVDKNEAREEFVDIWHFLVSLTLYMGLTPDDLLAEYKEKNEENHNRQDRWFGDREKTDSKKLF